MPRTVNDDLTSLFTLLVKGEELVFVLFSL